MTCCDWWHVGATRSKSLFSPPPFYMSKVLFAFLGLTEIWAVIPAGGDGHFSLESLGGGGSGAGRACWTIGSVSRQVGMWRRD